MIIVIQINLGDFIFVTLQFFISIIETYKRVET